MSLINDALKKAQAQAPTNPLPSPMPVAPVAALAPSPPAPVGSSDPAPPAANGLGITAIGAFAVSATLLVATAWVLADAFLQNPDDEPGGATASRYAKGGLLVQTQQAVGMASEMVQTSAPLIDVETAGPPVDPEGQAADGQAAGPSAGTEVVEEERIPAPEETEAPAEEPVAEHAASETPSEESTAGPATDQLATAEMIKSFALTGIMGGGSRRLAIVNRRVVHVGDAIGGARVGEILGDSVVLEVDGTRYEVPMQAPPR